MYDYANHGKVKNEKIFCWHVEVELSAFDLAFYRNVTEALINTIQW